MNSKILQKSIESRNREAIKRLVNLESMREWAKKPPELSRNEVINYFKKTGEDYLSAKKKVVELL